MVEEQGQDTQMHSSPKLVFERMIQATNRHDLDAMVACFAEDFRSEQPFHPERNFVGQAGVRKNWTFFFSTIPDMQVDILNEAIEGDILWAEVLYHGTGIDGRKQTTKGVTIQGVRANHILWARLYIESVAESL